MSEKLDSILEEVNRKGKRKSYKSSFLYNQSGKGGEDLMKKHDKLLINYIMNAERLDKSSTAFSGIKEEVKRQQTTSILYTILMMDNVYLCTASQELPPAFKVLDAFDLKSNDRRPAIFIDVTKLIIEKNGYYVCKNPGKLISYLLAALVYLTYRKDINKVVNNSAITISGAECYVSMFLYVLDYLRIVGYSMAKDKIAYFAGLFYLTNMLGKDLDTYTKNLAAKIAKINPGSVAAYDLYMEEGMFDNIDNFISAIAEIFKLKGLTTEVFVQKWIFRFGNGTQYACELFTSFAVILCYVFCGAYIVNQKQIEQCCGQSMIKFCNSLMIAGTDVFDRRMYMSESEIDHTLKRDYNTQALAESIRLSKEVKPEDIKFLKEDFASMEVIEKKVTDNLDYYSTVFDGDQQLESIFETAIKMAMFAMDSTTGGDDSFLYENGVLTTLIKNGKRFLTNESSNHVYNGLRRRENAYLEAMRENRDSNKEISKKYSKSLSEVRECQNIMNK